MVFKSGTQQLHAEAWEFLRNDALDAGNYFTNSAGGKPPELRFNEFGFNGGGPVTLGKLYNKDRNKTFFFYNMEWRRYIQGSAHQSDRPTDQPVWRQLRRWARTIHVPNASQLAPGVLAKFTALGLQPGQAFPNNTIPVHLAESERSGSVESRHLPEPNQWQPIYPGRVRADQRARRVGPHRPPLQRQVHDFWPLRSRADLQGYTTTMWDSDNVPTIGNTFGNPSYSGVVHAIHTISPTVINEMAFNYNGNRINIVNTGLFTRPSGFNVPRLFSGPNDSNRIPQINLAGATGSDYNANWIPWHNKADDYQFRDDLSWQKGAHSLKFGASFAYYAKTQDLFANTQGSFQFNGNLHRKRFRRLPARSFQLVYRSGGERRRAVEQQIVGGICSRQLARQQTPHAESGSAVGRSSAYV